MEMTSPVATKLKFPLSAIAKTLVNHQIPVLASNTETTIAFFSRHPNRTASAKVVTLFTKAAGLQWRKQLMILLHPVIQVISATQKTKKVRWIAEY